eukprot:3795553-Amphidinium_carterae.1
MHTLPPSSESLFLLLLLLPQNCFDMRISCSFTLDNELLTDLTIVPVMNTALVEYAAARQSPGLLHVGRQLSAGLMISHRRPATAIFMVRCPRRLYGLH